MSSDVNERAGPKRAPPGRTRGLALFERRRRAIGGQHVCDVTPTTSFEFALMPSERRFSGLVERAASLR